MRYGSLEYMYASPIALALIDSAAFREWVLSRSEFREYSDARLLHKEMASHRGNSSAEWWRFHFTEKCRCVGCSGKETDILAIFETKSQARFALHFEVKQPTDSFKSDGVQSRGYALRAQCWAAKAPTRVLPHQRASTGLFFSEAKRTEYFEHLDNFKALMTFEEIETEFPDVAKWLSG
ncbi:hypothetical protein [Bradyrhizobium sp. AUGA SZCCT0042]|uniref:hypothetical protein n=1 Tax=Bradyrhizobium sp. AUGA SZCCT0042 TaxID=2807651 RepID=UPI001BAA1EF1|nr:hypothetical protein [Bradyrhizobium sp. AUGA SZCCT0042]MBR1296633.1 hypothetical protein [Bradyrhizobium sp. AUGA SZCCT0042]